MKNILSMTIALLLGWLIVPAVAQNRMEVSGEQTQGSWLTDLSNNSSKFNDRYPPACRRDSSRGSAGQGESKGTSLAYLTVYPHRTVVGFNDVFDNA